MRRALLVLVLLVSCGGRVASSEQTGGDQPAGPAPAPPDRGKQSPPNSGPQPLPPPDLPPPPSTPGAIYTARASAGGLDHIEIFKADFTRDTCVHVHLASPQSPNPAQPFGNISTPADWAVRSAGRSKGASTCNPQPRTPQPAADGKGAITWVQPAGQVFPCTLNVHLGLIFDGSKTTDLLDADGVVVDNCM